MNDAQRAFGDADQFSRPASRPPRVFRVRAATSLIAAGAAVFVVAVLITLNAGIQAQSRTVWDGVYTETQAERALAAFSQNCAGCHTLAEQGEGPLAGEKFWDGYAQKTVGDFLTYVASNMPNGRGGSLPGSSYNDIVALILKSNGFPAGTTELSRETAAHVQIIPKDGPGELPANALARIVGCLARQGNDWVVTRATAPQRAETSGSSSEDATRPLGDRTTVLKFVLTRLDQYSGQRVSVTGMLMGAGGANGINVTSVTRVAETCN